MCMHHQSKNAHTLYKISHVSDSLGVPLGPHKDESDRVARTAIVADSSEIHLQRAWLFGVLSRNPTDNDERRGDSRSEFCSLRFDDGC